MTLLREYDVPPSTFYYWRERYQTDGTSEHRSRAPHHPHRKVTAEIKAVVLQTHKAHPRLGCKDAKPPQPPPEVLYQLTHVHHIWFIDHMHIRTLPSGQKVYSLIVVDGMSRVLLSEDVVLSKSARDTSHVLLRTFVRYGLTKSCRTMPKRLNLCFIPCCWDC